MTYLFILLLLIVLSGYFDVNKNVLPRRWYYIILIIFVTLVGLRFEIGGDTIGYINYYKESPTLSNLNDLDFKFTRFQPLWIYFMSFCKSISDNFVTLQIIHALLINVAIFYFIKKNAPFFFMSILIYFIVNYLEFNTECLRESLAVVTGLFAYDQLKRKRYFVFILLVFVAINFHISAIVLVLFPVANYVKYSKRFNNVFFVFICVIPFIFPYIPDISKYLVILTGGDEGLVELYNTREVDQQLNLFFYITFILKQILIPFFCMYILRSNKNIKFCGYIYIYIIFQVLSLYSYAFYRFSNYFSPFFIILLSTALILILKRISCSIRCRCIYILPFVFILLYIYQGYQLGINKSTGDHLYSRYIPYKSIIFK